MGTTSRQAKQFRVNPVEMVIFAVVCLVFCNSIYSLFYDRQGFRPVVFSPVESAQATAQVVRTEGFTGGRAPASVAPLFTNFEFECNSSTTERTKAGKLRLTGPLCGLDASEASDAKPLIKTQVVNTANRFSATVFTDEAAKKFSTDYIPLNSGKNPLEVEFHYQGGKIVTQKLDIERE